MSLTTRPSTSSIRNSSKTLSLEGLSIRSHLSSTRASTTLLNSKIASLLSSWLISGNPKPVSSIIRHSFLRHQHLEVSPTSMCSSQLFNSPLHHPQTHSSTLRKLMLKLKEMRMMMTRSTMEQRERQNPMAMMAWLMKWRQACKKR